MPAKKASKGGKKAGPVIPKTLTIASGKGASLATITRNLEIALGRIGCRACRSGIDKIVIGDRVINRIR